MNQIRRELLQLLDTLSVQYPEMRFGQLVVNLANWATHAPDNVYDVEDESLLQAAKSHLEQQSLTTATSDK